jgi:hypothetical protein
MKLKESVNMNMKKLELADMRTNVKEKLFNENGGEMK